jgi:hypothetical protein
MQANVPIAAVAKQYKDKLYIFAVAMTNSASQRRFTLESLTGAEALVLSEKAQRRDYPGSLRRRVRRLWRSYL